MVEIKDSEDLERWLQDRPREDAIALAARAALRVAPLLVTGLDKGAEERRAAILLPSLRAMAAPWVAAAGPTQGAEVREAADAAFAAANAVAFAAANAVANAVANAASAAARTAAAAARTASAARTAANASANASAAWEAVSADVTALEQGISSSQVTAVALWPDKPPEAIAKAWPELWVHLVNANEGWEVWTDWYDDRLQGRPFDMALEEARVLIDADLWKQGPKVVNAEIARLIEEHKSKPPPVPEMPGERGTPIHFEFRDGALHRAPPEPPHPPEDRRAAAERGWAALRQMLDDFQASGGGNQNPRLKTVLKRCGEGMGAEFDALDVILLGVYIARLQGFADRADEVLMAEDAAELVALNAQFGIFLAQFPEWAGYASGIGDGFGEPEAEQKAVADAISALNRIEQEAPGLLAPDAQEGLAALAEAATPEPTVDIPAPIAPPVERRSFLRAVRSALRALSNKAIEIVRSGASKGVEKYVESAVAAALTGSSVWLLELAGALSGEFGWIAGMLTFFMRMAGSSSDNRPAKDDTSNNGDDTMDA